EVGRPERDDQHDRGQLVRQGLRALLPAGFTARDRVRPPRVTLGSVEEPETKELRILETEREGLEREHAREADLPAEERTAERRAEKQAYRREKLEERARSEEEG